MSIEAVIEQAMKLSVEERTEIATRLLDSVDNESVEDPEHVAAWTAEIDRRLLEIQEGRVQLIDASEAFAQARAIAARRR